MKAGVKNCLNCGNQVTDHYCPQCGQKRDTHRLSIGHFLLHDMLHGIWHLERGILFTLKEIVIRPGYVARDYIDGKRIKYYNFFSLLILSLAVNFFINRQLYVHEELDPELQRYEAFLEFIERNGKLFLFLLMPFMALCSFLVFRRLRYNYTEHLIPPILLLIAGLIIDILGTLTDNFFGINWIEAHILELYLIGAFGIFMYYQFTRRVYSFWGFLWRMLLTFLLFIVIISVLLKVTEWGWSRLH